VSAAKIEVPDVLDARSEALACWTAGWQPVALVPGEKAKSFEPWGEYRDRRMTMDEVLKQFDAYPQAGVGLVMRDGVFRLDLDGPAAPRLLQWKGITIPDGAPRVRTGRDGGGEHIYLRARGVQLPSLSGDKPLIVQETQRVAKPSAVELRSNDLAPIPPTIHPSGRPYEWVVRLSTPDAVPEAPVELLRLIAARARELAQLDAKKRRSSGGANPRGPHWAAEAMRGAGQGERNVIGTRLCGYLFRCNMHPAVVREVMLQWSDRCDPPMTTAEVDAIVNSLARKHPSAGLAEEEQPGAIWYADAIEEHCRRRSRPQGSQWAAPTIFPTVSKMFRGGFKSGRLYFIGGQPGVGKTALVIGTADEAGKMGLRVLFVSAEMPREAIFDRHVAMRSGLDVGDVEDGHADPGALAEAGEEMARLPIAVANEKVRGVADIAKVVRELQPQVVIVDYLQLISQGEKGRDKRERVESVSGGLKQVAKENACAVVCVSSLRKVDGKQGMPSNADLRESGALEFDADGIILVGFKGEGSTERIARVTKNRYGTCGEIVANFDGARMRLHEIGRIDELYDLVPFVDDDDERPSAEPSRAIIPADPVAAAPEDQEDF